MSVPDTENALPFLVVIVLIVPAFIPETYRLKRWAVCWAKIGVASDSIVKMASVWRMIGLNSSKSDFPLGLRLIKTSGKRGGPEWAILCQS